MSHSVRSEALPDYVREETVTMLEECAERLPIDETVNLELFPMADLVEREEWFGSREKRQKVVETFRERLYGVGGSTAGEDISIYVDVEIDGHRSFLSNAVAHEYNHLARNDSWDRDSQRLVDKLVLEGLALCFEIEMTGTEPPYARTVSQETARTLFEGVANRLGSTDPQLRSATFYGTHADDEFEPWAGYVLAYELVRQTQLIDELDWSQLVATDSTTFVAETDFVG